MTLQRARVILAAYQAELDHEAATRRLMGSVERPVNLLALGPRKQLSLAKEIAGILGQPRPKLVTV